MSLPAGPMISLTVALEGVCTLWPRGGEPPRQLPAIEFVTGNHTNVLRPGELLRKSTCPPRRSASARVPPGIADQARPLGRTAHRHRDSGAARPAAHHHCGDTSGPVQLRFAAPAIRSRAAAGASTRRSSEWLFRRRARHRRLQAPPDLLFRRTDSRRAGAAGSKVMNDIAPCDSATLTLFTSTSPLRGHARAWPVPAHLPARARLVRRQEGLRRGRLRRLHRLARRRARA